jgi:predicted outer membrane repeat protein
MLLQPLRISSYKRSGVLAIAILVVGWTTASGATWFVSPQGTDTPGCGMAKGIQACLTIQYTISKRASDGDMVKVAPAIYAENLKISKSITLAGNADSSAIVDGGRLDTVILVKAGTTVSLSNLVIRHGFTRKAGGGILNRGILTMDRCIVTENAAKSNGESRGNGGGIYNFGALTVVHSTVSRNKATEGGGILNLGVVHLRSSTLSGNTSESFGAGIESFGNLTIVNSTFANNVAIYGGAIYSVATTAISSSTFSGNSAIIGGGVYNAQPQANVTSQNTIIAGNIASYRSPDCAGIVTSQDYNLIGDTSGCSIALGEHDLIGVSAELGPLSDNGGPTHTMALLTGSPAIDAGNPDGCTNNNGVLLTVDQRIFPRPSPQGGLCDIGAYELQQ